jgi:branched-chain amino acid transport system ATP-binding protein
MSLTVDRVRAGYGPIEVLSDVSVRVGERETVALLGPNGAGKSTLVSTIAGLVAAREGAIRYADTDLARLPPHRIVAAGIRVVPEGRRIFAPLSVEDNLRLGAIRLSAARNRDRQFELVFSLFPRLKERRTQLGGTMSGGEQQMLAIGRALMSAPSMLLLDEPFLGLAPLIVEEILRAIAALRREGLSVLLVEQKVDLALSVADRAYVLVKGRVVHEDAAATLRASGDLGRFYFAGS